MGVRLRQAVTNFSAGEISPLARARSDIKLFQNGAEKLTNRAPLSQGGTRTRPALRYLATIANPFAACKLLPFVFNNQGQAYAFAMLNGQAKVFNPDGTLATTLAAQPWTSGMFNRLIAAQFADTMLLFHPQLPTQKILRTGASSFAVSAFAFEAPTSGAPIYQPYFKFVDLAITMTPSATTGSIALSTSGDVFVAGHVGTRFRWAPEPNSTTPNPALVEMLVTAVADARNATATVTGGTLGTGPATGSAGADVSLVSEQGALGGGSGAPLANTNPSTNWDEQAFSVVRGYPNSGDFFSNRLCLGGSASLPMGIWISKTGAYFNFDLGTGQDNEAIWDSITDAHVSEIRHTVGAQDLLWFGDRSVFYTPVSPSNPLTPKNYGAYKQQPYGANFMPPVFYDGAVIFAQDTGNVIREALWNALGIYTTKAYSADPISLLGAHLIKDPSQLAVMYGTPGYPEIYAVMPQSDGTLTVFHSIRNQQVAGWVPWVTPPTVAGVVTGTVSILLGAQSFVVPAGMGLTTGQALTIASAADSDSYVTGTITAYSGTLLTLSVTDKAGGGFTDGQILVPASIVSAISLAGQVFVAVKRYLGGVFKLTLEVFDDTAEAVDCCIVATSGSATKTFAAAAPHLAGQTVSVVSIGHYLGDYLVANDGTITLSTLAPAVKTITAGLQFEQRIRPMPARFDLPDGASAGVIEGLVRTLVQVDKSCSFRQDGQDILLDFAGDDFTNPASTKTGFVEVRSLGYDRDAQRDIVVDRPGKLTVLGLTREVAVNG